MITGQFTVLNELGIHARAASRIVREARKYESSITVQKEGNEFNLKNVTAVIMVGAKYGDILLIEFNGSDEKEAAAAIDTLFLSRFGER